MNLQLTLLSICALFALPQLVSAQSGVGTITPDADKALHVRAAAAQDPLRLEGLRLGVDGEEDVIVTDANGRLRYRSINDLTLATEWRNDATNSYIYAFRALNEGPALDVVITDAGDFGIGTTAPAFNFDLFGTAAVRTLPGGDVDGVGSLDDNVVTADQATGQLKAVSVADLISQNAEWVDDLSGNFILARRARAAGNMVAVTDGGFMGIGTATPLAPLHLTRGGDLAADGSSGVVRIERGNKHIGIDDNEIQAFSNSAVSELNLQADGNDVRIGSNSPGTSWLDAYGHARVRRMEPGNIIGIPTDDRVVVVAPDGELRKVRADDLFDAEGEWVDNASSTYIYAKRARDEGSTDFVVIDDDGRLGIGEVNPQEKLHIDNGGIRLDGLNGIAFNGETPFGVDAQRDGARIYSEGNVFGKWKDALIIEKTDFNNGGVDGGIVFANRADANTRVNAMIIDGASNVGIADGDNDDIRRRFQVDGDVLIHDEGENTNASRGLLRLVDDANGDYLTRDWATRGVQVRDDNDYVYFGLRREAARQMDAVAMWGNNREDFRFIQIDGNVEREVMTLAGDNQFVGIGETVRDPQQQLHVGGRVRVNDLPAGDADQDRVVMAQADGDLVQVPVADLFQENEDDDWVIAGNNIYNANSGNVGIGVTDPAYPLDLGGWSRIRENNRLVLGKRNENHIHSIGDDEWRISTRRQLNFVEADGSTQIMTVRGDRGNVGIGTTDPDAGYGLHIAEDAKVEPNKVLQFGDNPLNRVYSPNLTDLRIGGDTRIGFRNNGDSRDVVTVQTRDERVGIRTTTPGRIGAANENVALDINGRLRVRDLPAGDEDNDFFVTTDGDGDLRRVQLTDFEGPWVRDNAGNVRPRTVTDQVGIGLTNPTSSLHIYEPTGTTRTGADGTIVLEHGNSGGMSSIVFRSAANPGSDHAFIQYQDNASGNGFSNENGLLTIGIENDIPGSQFQDDIAIMSSGYVGVGTTTPTNDFHVAGGVRIEDLPNDTDAFAVTTDNDGNLSRQPISSIKDNLGNHDMELDLVTGDNSIRYARNDGGPDLGIKLTPQNSVMTSNRLQVGSINDLWIDNLITDNAGNPVSTGFAGNDGAIFAPIYTDAETSDLRLYILDNGNDAFSIWGDPCASGDCDNINNSSEVVRFRADGQIFARTLRTGGGPDQMVVADANGNLKLGGVPGGGASTGGDNLGNHVATQNIILGNNDIRGQNGFRIEGNTGNTFIPNSRGLFWGGNVFGTGISGSTDANGDGNARDLRLEANDDIYLYSKGGGGDLLARVGGGVVMKARREFRFSAGPDNGNGNNGNNNDFRFYTNNTNDDPADPNYGQERFRIQNNGQIRIPNLGGGGTRVVLTDNDGVLFPTNGSSDGLWTRDNFNEETYLENRTDQVGIGTGNPEADLHVSQFHNYNPANPGSSATELRLENRLGNGSSSIYFKEGNGGEFGMRISYDGNHAGGGGGGGRLQITQANGEPYASFERTGEVGIGVVNPETKLHVMNATVAGDDQRGLRDPATVRIQHEATDGSAAVEFVEGANNARDNSMSLRYNSKEDGSEDHFEIVEGLATETDADRVHFRVERTNGTVTVRDLATGAGNPDEYVVADADGVLRTRTIAQELLSRGTGNNTYVTNLGDAFGIGTTNPSSRLHVAGDARIETFGAGANTDEVVTRDAFGNLRSIPFATLESPWDRSAADGTYLATGSDNVGIGTSTPTAKLDVVGTARVSTLAGVGTRLVVANAAGQLAPRSLDPYLSHWKRTDGATVDYLNLVSAGDRVGIGTTGTPQATLHVAGTSRISSLANATNGEMVMANASGDLYTQVLPEELWLRAGNVTQLANGGDDVGIGTGNPQATLDIEGDLRVNEMLTAAENGNDRVVVRGPDGILRQAEAGQYDSPWVENDANNRVTLKNTDRWVGIGTDAPASAFHVEDNVNGNMEVRLQNRRGNGAVQMRFRTGGNSGGFNDQNNSMTLRYSNASDALEITNGYVNADANYASYFKVRRNNGNVGIGLGTDAPSEKLHVRGDIRLDDTYRLRFAEGRSYLRDAGPGDVELSADNNLALRADGAVTVRADGDDIDLVAGDEMLFRTNGGVRAVLRNDGRFEVRNGPNDDDLDVQGRTRTNLFRLENGAQNGYVLQSVDNNGNANWVDPLTVTTAPTGPWTETGNTAVLAAGINRVGIGVTPAAGVELDVNGDIRMRSLADNSTESRVLVADAAGDLSTRTVNSLGSDDQRLTLTTNTLALENGGTPINLAPYLDNTDAQTLGYTAATREITLTNGGSVTLPTDADDQQLSVNPATGILTLTNDATDVNLSAIAAIDDQDLTIDPATGVLSLTNDGTPVNLSGVGVIDDQALSISGNRISLVNGGFVDLPADTDTDEQKLSFTGTTLAIERGGAGVDLASINTDDQDLAFDAGTAVLSLTNDATPVDLSAVAAIDDQDLTLDAVTGVLSLTNDGTSVNLSSVSVIDDQALSISGNTISLTNGGSVTLPADVDTDTDEQKLSLAGTTLSIERGGTGVDLGPLVATAKDNLGNHTATQTLNMDGEWINGDADPSQGLLVTNAGRLGINVAAPAVALHVGGQAQIDTLTEVAATTFVVATDGSGRLTKIMPVNLSLTASDRRLKNDITPITGALNALDSLSAVSFSYKPASETGVQLDSATHYGVIAQEVQKFFPHAVKEGADGYLRVNYDELIGVLLASSKELKTRNAELESQVSELQQSVQAIEAFIAAQQANTSNENTIGGNE